MDRTGPGIAPPAESELGTDLAVKRRIHRTIGSAHPEFRVLRTPYKIQRAYLFQVALHAAEKSKLKLSSRLLAVAARFRAGTP